MSKKTSRKASRKASYSVPFKTSDEQADMLADLCKLTGFDENKSLTVALATAQKLARGELVALTIPAAVERTVLAVNACLSEMAKLGFIPDTGVHLRIDDRGEAVVWVQDDEVCRDFNPFVDRGQPSVH